MIDNESHRPNYPKPAWLERTRQLGEPNFLIVQSPEDSFSHQEDLFQSVNKAVFEGKHYDRLLEPNEMLQIYMDYRDTTDVELLLKKLNEAQKNFEDVIGEQEAERVKNDELNHGMLPMLEEPGSPADWWSVMQLKKNVLANCEVDVLKHIIRYNANRQGIDLSENQHFKPEVPSEAGYQGSSLNVTPVPHRNDEEVLEQF